MQKDKITAGKFAGGSVLSIISGVLLAASMPPVSIAPAAWVALVPTFIALLKFAPNNWSFGFYYGLTYAVWFACMIRDVPAGYTALYAAPVGMFILMFLFSFWQRNIAQKNNARLFTAVITAGFLAFEFIRSMAPTATFAVLGISQYKFAAAIQIASIFGVLGVSLFILLINCTIAVFIANASSIAKVKMQVIVNIVIIFCLAATNMMLYRQELPEKSSIRAAAVQLGYAPEDKTHPGLEKFDALVEKKDWVGSSNAMLDVLEPLTIDAAGQGAELIVWPEVVLTDNPTKYPQIQKRVEDLAVKTKAWLVVPYHSFDKGHEKLDDHNYTNEAALVSPEGKFVFRYLKQHMVTSLGIEKGRMGNKSIPYEIPKGKLGILICYDADYPLFPMRYVKAGAELFPMPSHDLARFISWHHPALEMFRSVELHRSIVKSDYVNGSLIVDPKGRILADPEDGRAIVVADVPFTTDMTPYLVIGPIFGWGCVTAFILILLYGKFTKEEA